MKIYLSGPITGIENYKENFEAAEREARERLSDWEPEIFNPANITLPDTATHEDYMKICMQKLADCNTIYMLNGWQESRGANREYGYALGRQMAILRQPKHEKDKTFAERVMDKFKKIYEEDSK